MEICNTDTGTKTQIYKHTTLNCTAKLALVKMNSQQMSTPLGRLRDSKPLHRSETSTDVQTATEGETSVEILQCRPQGGFYVPSGLTPILHELHQKEQVIKVHST